MRTTVGLRFLYGYMKYDKLPIDLPQQLENLKQRGLSIANEEMALEQLHSISYFRLASYWSSMENQADKHQFLPDSNFEDIITTYTFDKKLRTLVFTSIQDIEIALRDMMKETLQTMLENELTEQLGYDKYDYSNVEKDNYRNGYSKKTVHSTNGDIELNIPRDRNGDFEPTIVKKGSKDISNIEDKIIPHIREWKKRPLDNVYPVVFVDATYFLRICFKDRI